MQSKDKNFWKYILKYTRWLFGQQQLWKLLLPLYLIAAGVWFVVYYQESMLQHVLRSNNELKTNVDSLSQTLKRQQAEFKLILMDIMGDYGDITPPQAVFLNKNVPLNHLSARQSLNWIYRYLFRHKMEVRDALERFHFYEAAIIDTLRKNNLPLDLRFVFLAESWSYPLAVSKAGAAGGWQFMHYTAIEAGVEINRSVDMRRDVWYMSKTFCDYIKRLRNHSKSLPAALRAYNTGLDRFLKAAAHQSWVSKVWFIDTNDENNIYLFWILAWKFIYKKPLEFGIKVKYDFPPLHLKVIKIRLDSWHYRENLTFLTIAKTVNCDLFLLKDLNPAFLKVNRRGYRIIPGSRLKRYAVRYFKLPAGVDLAKLKQIKLRGVKFIF